MTDTAAGPHPQGVHSACKGPSQAHARVSSGPRTAQAAARAQHQARGAPGKQLKASDGMGGAGHEGHGLRLQPHSALGCAEATKWRSFSSPLPSQGPATPACDLQAAR
jgi:hypothetical protein